MNPAETLGPVGLDDRSLGLRILGAPANTIGDRQFVVAGHVGRVDVDSAQECIASEADRIAKQEIAMKLERLFVAVPIALLILGCRAANAGKQSGGDGFA